MSELPESLRRRARASRANPEGTRAEGKREEARAFLAGGSRAEVESPFKERKYTRSDFLQALRYELAQLPEAEWIRWRDQWAALFDEKLAFTGDDPDREAITVVVNLAAIMPDEPAWSARVAAKLLADPAAMPKYMSDVALVRDNLRDLATFEQMLAIPLPVPDAPTVLESLGPAAVPLLERVYSTCLLDDRDQWFLDPTLRAAHIATYLEVFALFLSASNLPLLLEAAESTAGNAALVSAARLHPERLVELARGTRHPLLRDLVRMLVTQRPELAAKSDETMQQWLSARPAPADTAQLPEVLREPPWRGAKVVKPVVIAGLEPPTSAPTMHWNPRERERANLQGRGDAWTVWNWSGSYETAPDAFADATLKNLGGKRWSTDSANQRFSILPEPHLRAAWAAFSPTAWQLDRDAAKRIVARLELDALEGMLVRAGIGAGAPPTHTQPFPPRPARSLAQSLEALRPVRAVAIAEAAAQGISQKQARKHARAWLTAHPQTAAAGLVPIALSKSKSRPGAEACLRFLAERGHREAVMAAASGHSEAAAQAIGQQLEQSPYALTKAPKLPAWSWHALVPPRLADGSAVQGAALETLLGMLAVSTPDAPYAGLEPALAACDPASLGPFGWSLLRLWWLHESDSEQSWAFTALAHLAGDAEVRQLAALQRTWMEAGLTARAKTCVEVLGGVGSDLALFALSQLAGKKVAKSVVEAAARMIAEIAEQRELTPEELGDRLVPDLGLGSDGLLDVDLGGTHVRVGLDEALGLTYRDVEGTPLDGLPKVGKNDKERYKQAKATLKAFEKSAKQIAEQVLGRLEQAMRAARSWPADVARACFFEHPLMRHLATRLAWVELAEDGSVRGAFRVAEDATLANENDDTYELGEGARVALLHPLHVSSETLAALLTRFTEYRLMQPFPQLGRPAHALDLPAWQARIDALTGSTAQTRQLFGLEGRRGWQRTAVGLGTRPLGAGEVRLRYSPGIEGGPDAQHVESHRIDSVAFDGVEPSTLHTIVRSELLLDLEGLQGT